MKSAMAPCLDGTFLVIKEVPLDEIHCHVVHALCSSSFLFTRSGARFWVFVELSAFLGVLRGTCFYVINRFDKKRFLFLVFSFLVLSARDKSHANNVAVVYFITQITNHHV